MKDESLIPSGVYCYTYIDGKQVNCPYWGRDPSRPQQESGFCTFLNLRDWDDIPGIPLLWDSIKECGINNGHEEFDDVV
jgi:hypothetical protein